MWNHILTGFRDWDVDIFGDPLFSLPLKAREQWPTMIQYQVVVIAHFYLAFALCQNFPKNYTCTFSSVLTLALGGSACFSPHFTDREVKFERLSNLPSIPTSKQSSQHSSVGVWPTALLQSTDKKRNEGQENSILKGSEAWKSPEPPHYNGNEDIKGRMLERAGPCHCQPLKDFSPQPPLGDFRKENTLIRWLIEKGNCGHILEVNYGGVDLATRTPAVRFL